MKENDSLQLRKDFPAVTTAEWEAVVRKDLKGADPGKLLWKTDEGIAIKPFYRAEELRAFQPQLGVAPGEFPFVRGTRADNEWSIRQSIDLADPVQANAAAREALAAGAESICFEVVPEGSSVRGVAVQGAEDMRKLIADLPTNLSISFRTHEAARAILPLYLSQLKDAEATGSVDFDPLGDLLLLGASPYEAEQIFAEAAELISFADAKAPRLRTLAVRGWEFSEAGGTVVQQLAFSLAAGVEYLAQLTRLGLEIDKLSSKIFFVLSVSSNYFFEIAKLRAFRMLWAQAVEQFKPKQAEAAKAFVESVTSPWGMTVYDAHNNLLRGTTEAMSAAIGGSDAIEITTFDAAYEPGDDFSRRLSRNAQVILKKEAYLNRVADPGGGSYYIEVLTYSLAREAWKLFQQIEAKGGFLKSVEAGFVQQEINNSRQKKDAAVAVRRRPLLGTNQFPNQNEKALEKFDLHGNLTSLRVTGVRPEAKPALLFEQFSKGLTLGDCLSYAKPALTVEKLMPYRGAEPFEALRLSTELHVAKGGKRPRVLLLEFGDLKMRQARAGFSLNFFAAAGVEVVSAVSEDSADVAARAIADKDPDLVVLCSSDQQYAAMARPLIEKLSARKPVPVIVAGYPKDAVEELKRDGVADFIHVQSNALEVLTRWLREFGVAAGEPVEARADRIPAPAVPR